MDKINHQYLAVKRLKTIPVKTLGVIAVCLIFMMGLSACKTTRAMSGHATSKALAKNLYPDKKPLPVYMEDKAEVKSIPHIRTYPKGKQSISVDKLKQSGWWAAAQKDIHDREYHVTFQKETYLPDVKEAYHAANRSQNLRAYFTPDGVRVMRRTEKSPTWNVGLEL